MNVPKSQRTSATKLPSRRIWPKEIEANYFTRSLISAMMANLQGVEQLLLKQTIISLESIINTRNANGSITGT